MKTIKATLNVRGMNRAINDLAAYRDGIKTKIMVSARQLALYAVEAVEEAYNSSSITVNAVPLDDNRLGYAIVAEGKDGEGSKAVGFLEFGAGTMADVSHPLAQNAPFAVYPGSYSEQNAHQFETFGYWIFGGVKYYFVRPRRGLYYGSEYIKEHVKEVVRRSFGGRD